MKLTNEEGRKLLNKQAKKKPVTKWPEPKLSESGKQTESIKLFIKPLSVNNAWQGKRFRSDAYNEYRKAIKRLLPAIELPPPPYCLSFVFGFSNNASDLDNPVKCIQDILAENYGFNDKLITELHIKKEIVAKGSEFIQFDIKTAL
jgi:hypothetical protein